MLPAAAAQEGGATPESLAIGMLMAAHVEDESAPDGTEGALFARSQELPLVTVTTPVVEIGPRSVLKPKLKTYNKTLAELLREPGILDPIQIVVPGVAAAGHTTLLFAREKAGKTTFIAYCAAHISRGGQLWGQPVPKGKVLWVGLEERRAQAVQRFLDMGGDESNINFLDRLYGDGGFEQLTAEIIDSGATVVVLDSLAAYAGGEDENSAGKITALLLPLVKFVHDLGIALIVLHHSNKASGYRGSVAIGASVDMLLEMKEGASGETSRRMEAKGRFRLPAYEVTYDEETNSFHLADAPPTEDERRAGLRARVYAFVAANPGAGKAHIREAMRGNAREVDLAIEALMATGKLHHRGHREGYVVLAEQAA
jgi:hypothetical protein